MATPEDTLRRSRCRIGLLIVFTSTVVGLGYFWESPVVNFSRDGFEAVAGIVPQDLLRLNVYSEDRDFLNYEGVSPPFWDCSHQRCNISSIWGPCYAPHGPVDWEKEVSNVRRHRSPIYHKPPISPRSHAADIADYCRPGFLIIGAGKCGTSSLYHYLSDHPRVLPASEKQIHYFKYFPEYPLEWYYRHFPTAKNFLASGALITGEASPGYLPYPAVAYRVAKRMPGPKIIAVGRNPLERSYSSYRYNYVTPTLDLMKSGKFKHIERGRTDEYYHQFLFSYEDLLRAELDVLRLCFAQDGAGVVGARKKWTMRESFRREFERRNTTGLPSLVDLEGFCYGKPVNRTVLRPQWADLVAQYPEKVFDPSTLHLVQSLIGRSLYTLPLEWWYAMFPASDIYFVCTEEMRDLSGNPMSELAGFLGLPEYNFSGIVSGGAYNVGGHRGYNKEMKWDSVKETRVEVNTTRQEALPEAFREELLNFIRPFNERLFQLTGRRCNWT